MIVTGARAAEGLMKSEAASGRFDHGVCLQGRYLGKGKESCSRQFVVVVMLGTYVSKTSATASSQYYVSSFVGQVHDDASCSCRCCRYS